MSLLSKLGSKGGFRSRSSSRDTANDHRALSPISDAIDLAIQQAEAEREGLRKRIDIVISRAALVGGNDASDYETRSDARIDMLRMSDAEIKRGHERLAVIDQAVEKFRSLKQAFQSLFPVA